MPRDDTPTAGAGDEPPTGLGPRALFPSSPELDELEDAPRALPARLEAWVADARALEAHGVDAEPAEGADALLLRALDNDIRAEARRTQRRGARAQAAAVERLHGDAQRRSSAGGSSAERSSRLGTSR